MFFLLFDFTHLGLRHGEKMTNFEAIIDSLSNMSHIICASLSKVVAIPCYGSIPYGSSISSVMRQNFCLKWIYFGGFTSKEFLPKIKLFYRLPILMKPSKKIQYKLTNRRCRIRLKLRNQ